VGIDVNTNPAIAVQGMKVVLAWYIHTESVHMLWSWHTIIAHSQLVYAHMNAPRHWIARIGFISGSVITMNIFASLAPSIVAAS